MAKKTNVWSALITDKVNELKASIASTRTDSAISKNTRGTKLYALGKERRTLELIDELINQIPDVKLSEQATNILTTLTTLAGERKRYDAVAINEGDSLLAVLKKYEDRNNIMDKINKACEKAGLVIDYGKGGIFVAK